MPSNGSPLDRFLRRVARRIAWRQRLRQIQFSLALACVAAFIVWLFFQCAFPVLAAILGLGLLIGLIRAAGAGVSLLAAAQVADHRLHLKDLLATACCLPAASSDLFSQRVVAIANARCRQLHPAMMRTTIFDARAAGAVALAMAMVLSLGLFSSSRADSTPPITAAALNRLTSPLDPAATPPPTQILRLAGDVNLNEISNRPTNPLSPPTNNPSAPIARAGNDAPASNHSAAPGNAAGLARTPTRIAPPTPIYATDGSPVTNQRGAIAGGGSALAPAQSAGKIAGLTGSDHPPTAAAPWTASTWPAAQDAASRSIDAGRIDPADQDIVRDYFQR